MVGDTQGDFRPRANISRAEVATAVNRILGRIDSRAALEALEELDIADARNFPDVADDAWYFASVLGATNDHYLTRGGGESISGKAIVGQ
ncbi:MAG: S-layer homology domain-containing protein, partial [Oscillospiraceae bacterium]|nr:S-layer homology domain-containing protein [Oscillospiraceae bacterium]